MISSFPRLRERVKTGRMIKKTVTTAATLRRVGAIFAFTLVMLSVVQLGGVSTRTESTIHTQFDYEEEVKCVMPFCYIMYVFEGLLLINGVYYADITRRVEATISNGKAKTEGTT
jgi:hypothetical protein